MRVKFKAVGIFVTMTVLFVGGAFGVVSSALNGETNLDIMADTLFPCKMETIPVSERMVVMRIDDVQAYAWSDISKRMISDMFAYSAPPVIGVIPKNLKEDADLYRFLRENRCRMEIAQHGWDHNNGEDGVTPEFRGLDKEEALGRILKGKKVVETLSRRDAVTFIPPQNEQSGDTTKALVEAEIPILSQAENGYFDFHAATFDYNTDSLVSSEKIIEQCEERFETSDLCVIMMHPQDFTTNEMFDPEKYQIFTDLLESLSKKDVTFIRFEDIYEHYRKTNKVTEEN